MLVNQVNTEEFGLQAQALLSASLPTTSAGTVAVPSVAPTGPTPAPVDKTEQSQSTGETDSKSVSAAEPFMLGEGLPVIPAKLVVKILKGTYVDMADLLQDNIALEKRVSTTDQETGALKSTVGKKRERMEDVQGLLSWAECFNTFTCVVVSKALDKFKPLTVYQSMIIREARRFGFHGWLQYDHLFRQQAARSLQTGGASTQPCTHCRSSAISGGTPKRAATACAPTTQRRFAPFRSTALRQGRIGDCGSGSRVRRHVQRQKGSLGYDTVGTTASAPGPRTVPTATFASTAKGTTRRPTAAANSRGWTARNRHRTQVGRLGSVNFALTCPVNSNPGFRQGSMKKTSRAEQEPSL